MYIQPETYAVAAAFVLGYDQACEGGVLVGFREWLVVRVGTGPNLNWIGLSCRRRFRPPGLRRKSHRRVHRMNVTPSIRSSTSSPSSMMFARSLIVSKR